MCVHGCVCVAAHLHPGRVGAHAPELLGGAVPLPARNAPALNRNARKPHRKAAGGRLSAVEPQGGKAAKGVGSLARTAGVLPPAAAAAAAAPQPAGEPAGRLCEHVLKETSAPQGKADFLVSKAVPFLLLHRTATVAVVRV